MGSDESLVTLISAGLTLLLWYRWFSPIAWCSGLGRAGGPRLVLVVAGAVCLGGLFVALRNWAASDVRSAPQYLLMYELLGAAWIGAGADIFARLAVSARDDAVERSNWAAVWACTGAVLGLTLCFAGANFGEGPGWSVVVFAALLSTAGLAVLWLVLDIGGAATEVISVERDLASGVRVGLFLVAAGIVLGRAVAGNWVTAQQTMIDFGRVAWPLPIGAACELALLRVLRPTPQHVAGPVAAGVLPGMLYVAAACGYAARWGPW